MSAVRALPAGAAQGPRLYAVASVLVIGCASAPQPIRPPPSQQARDEQPLTARSVESAEARPAALASSDVSDAASPSEAPDAARFGGASARRPASLPKSERDCPVVKSCPSGMSLIPGGKSRQGPYPYVCSFCLDLTEVAVAAYSRCVTAKVCAEPNPYDGTDRKSSWQFACNWKHPDGHANHPINCISVTDARTYCTWRGARLPTGSEYFWASAGGDEDRPFPWGSAPPDGTRVNGCGKECGEKADREGRAHGMPYFPWRDNYPETAPVGSFPAGNGRWGNADLSGNVCEYTEDAVRGVCGGSFLIILVGDSLPMSAMFRAGSCDHSADPTGRSAEDGFRCASGGRPILRNGSLEPIPD
jgi:sulfatase modifying factor 1